MYLYTDFDQQLINQRVAQFRDQTERYLAGKLTEDEYRPLRLQNGLYVQRYAPMLRIAVPYGLMNTKQLRKIAEIATEYDRGYAHVSTRQNIQLNWPALENVPDILAELATVQMHAVQTSGNCIRNTTTDQFAGVVAGEIADPRPTCEFVSGVHSTLNLHSCHVSSKSPFLLLKKKIVLQQHSMISVFISYAMKLVRLVIKSWRAVA
jgi:sulfite reductase (NADPH) hemoprotein beta-component